MVDAENYLLHVSRYIHLNPVEANLAEKPEDCPWSSFQYYCQIKKRVDWLNYTDILNRFNIKNKRDSYKEFVYEGIDLKTNKIYNASKMVPIFGEDLFCQKIKEKLKITTHQEIPQSKELSTYFITKDKVVKEIAKYYRCSEIDIISGSDKRLKKIAVYFCERLTNNSQKQIGQFFSDISYSAISQISRRIRLEIEKDSRFKKEINGLGIILSNVKT